MRRPSHMRLLLLLGTVHANDITSTCAAAFRLTLKGYVSTGKDPSKVCSPAPATCRRPAGIYHMYCKQCAGYVMGKNVFNPLSSSVHGWHRAASRTPQHLHRAMWGSVDMRSDVQVYQYNWAHPQRVDRVRVCLAC